MVTRFREDGLFVRLISGSRSGSSPRWVSVKDPLRLPHGPSSGTGSDDVSIHRLTVPSVEETRYTPVYSVFRPKMKVLRTGDGG